ncbi:MAG: ABC transporter ATP-binding protein [Oscillospiraceae bacterium]|nr:ABC transporter ATP-binding protein [Oscillospiraceae bacterium]
MIDIDNVFLRYDNLDGTHTNAVNGVSVRVKDGERLAVVGASGCGKSSLLYLTAGLAVPNSGAVLYNGRPMTSPHADIALILQDYGLFPWKTVYKNAALSLKLRGADKAEIKKKVTPLLEEMGLADKLNAYPESLSGGQRQRVAIARALVTEPKVLLMDEPFAALDVITQESMEDIVLNMCEKSKLTLIMVTHNIEEAVFIGQRIAIFGPEPGKLANVEENPHCGEPDYRRSPMFFRLCNSVRAQLRESKNGGGTLA